MKQALVMLDERIRKQKIRAKFVANVHDEFQIECHPDDAEYLGETAKQCIIDAGKYFELRCPLDGEYKIGRNWKETH